MQKTKSRTPLLVGLFIIIALLPAAIYLTRNPLFVKATSYMDLNEGSGATIHDTISAITGTITNAIWKTENECVAGPCLYFDGTGDYVAFGDENAYDFIAATNWTIELWFKTPAISSGTRTLIAKHNATAGGYKIYMSSDGKLNFGIDDDSTWEPDDLVTSTARYDDNTWHHLAAIKTGTSNITLYIDATPVGQDTSLAATSTLANADIFYLGIDGDGSSNGWSGSIDELKVFDTVARTPAQINTDYQKGSSIRGSTVTFGTTNSKVNLNPVAYWKFDESEGSTTYDSTTNGNNLTLINVARTADGKYNRGLDFESSGISNIAYSGDNTSFSQTGSFTLSTWIKPESITADTIFNIAHKTDDAYRLIQYGDEIRFYLGSASNYVTTTNTNLIADTWYHIVGAYDASIQTATIYVNGQAQTTSTTGTIPSSLSDGSGEFLIGGHSGNKVSISQSSDDARQSGTSMALTGITLESDATTEYLGFRFQNIEIPQGATLTQAYMSFYIGNSANDEPYHTIWGENSDNATTFTTGASNITNRTPTTATALWDNTNLGAPGTFSTVSLLDITQEIINRPGWTSGNAIAFIIQGSADVARDLVPYAYDHATDPEPTFTYVYSTGTSVYDGIIDEMKLFDFALTSNQVMMEYHNSSTQLLGSTLNSSHASTYCIPGDTTFCDPPVGEWLFEDGGNQTVKDSSGNGIHGTFGSSSVEDTADPTWSGGRSHGGIRLLDDDYVTIPDNDNFSVVTTGKLTVEGWAKYDVITDTRRTFNKNGGTQYEWYLGPANGALQAATAAVGGATYLEAISNITISANEWHHFAFTIDQSTNTMSLYLDGVNVGNDTTPGSGVMSNSVTPVRVGLDSNGKNGTQGYADSLRIYNYVRTPAQIAWSYNQSKPTALYAFNECDENIGHNTGFTSDPQGSSPFDATLSIGSSGTLTSTGTCSSGTSTESWNAGTMGKFDSALALDGTDDYATINDHNSLRFDANSTDFSLFSWVKRQEIDQTHQILSKEDKDNDGWRLIINADNTVTCSVNTIDITSTSTIDTNWHHIGCTITRAGNGQIYIDGKPDGTAVAISSTAMATTAPLVIGARSYTTTNYFNGLLDDVRIYNYVPTSGQIMTIMNNNAAIKF